MLTITFPKSEPVSLDLNPLDLYDMTTAELTEVRTMQRDKGGMWFPKDKLGRTLAVALKSVTLKLMPGDPVPLGYGIEAQFNKAGV